MKKFMMLILSGVSAIVLSGCGGGSSTYNEVEIRFHLVDQSGFGVSDILYTCDGINYDVTDGSGAFYFYPSDNCSFELAYPVVNNLVDDLFIIDDDGFSVQDIYYECTSGWSGYTDIDGYFKFDNAIEDDICTFEM